MYNVHCSRGEDILYLPLHAETHQPVAMNNSPHWASGVTIRKIAEADGKPVFTSMMHCHDLIDLVVDLIDPSHWVKSRELELG